jgi:hypothetical protein
MHKFAVAITQGDYLARGPTEVYLQICNEFVNQHTMS